MHLNGDLKALVTPISFCWNMFLQSNSYEIHVFSKDFFFSETEMIRALEALLSRGKVLWSLRQGEWK